MNVRRVALIFDDTNRPETTGVYCQGALAGLVDVVHFLPHDLGQISDRGFDLYLNIDDGLEYRLPQGLRPCAWWAIDTHLNFSWSLDKAGDFDLVFAAQRDGAEQLAAEGIASARWLPLACDPKVHRKFEVDKVHDVAFVGNLFPGPRDELVHLLRRRVRNTFVGRAYFEEMARVYSASRVVFNRSLRNDVNMRVFEALACGSLLMTNNLTENGQAEMFRDGVHLATYREAEELLDKVAYYLKHEALREKIAAAGRAEVLARHTYRHRMEELLEHAESMPRPVRPGRERFAIARRTETGDRDQGAEGERGLAPERSEGACPLSDGAAPVVPEKRDRHPAAGSLREEGVLSGPGASPLFPRARARHGSEEGDRHPATESVRGEPVATGPGASPLFPQARAMRVKAAPGSQEVVEVPVADPAYYGFARPELLGLVPETARRVLEVGCGAGRLGESIKARQDAEVVGIELNPAAALEASNRLDEVVVGDIESPAVEFEPGSFDCIVCGDVIEHMLEPERFLERAAGWLQPVGVLIASIPNVRHHSVVGALLDGNWTYEPAGLLDETHLGFFTRADILDLFARAGLRVELMGAVPGPGYDEWSRQGTPGEVRAGRLHIADLPPEEAEEFFAYQFLLVARPEIEQVAERVGEAQPAPIPDDDPTERSAPSRVPVPGRMRAKPLGGRDRPAIRFTQDFVRDFDQVDFWGRPFAFARFGDGEWSICRKVPVACRDGWVYDGRASRFSAELNASLTCDAPDYYVGISDGCCDREARDWFLQRVRVPRERLTFANLFVNGNYKRFRRLDLSGLVIVASQGGDFTVPDDIINGDFNLDGLVDQLLDVDRPMLVAAGPAACVIVHKYWLRADPERRQTIVDVGSAIDEMTKGMKTRGYHQRGSPTSERICQW